MKACGFVLWLPSNEYWRLLVIVREDISRALLFKMPILLKEFSWHQNSKSLLLKVNTGNVKPTAKNCAVMVTSRYVKLSLSPYIFELFLAESIEGGQATKVTYGTNHVTLTLAKAEVDLEWATLEEVVLEKEQKQNRRRQAEIEEQQYLQNNDASIQTKNEAMVKKNVEKQLEEMEESRKRIERVKQQVVKQALADTLMWKQTLPEQSKSPIKKMSLKQLEEKQEISEDSEDSQSEVEETEPEEPIELTVAFTPRVYPTPKRESSEQMELQWKKQREEAMRLVGFEPEKVEQADPGWMLQKSRELVESGQFQGAAAVASHALAACLGHSGLRLVLAVAYLHLGHWFQALECCSRALELTTLDPQTRSQLVAVRGVALVRSGHEEKGRGEIESGLAQCQIDSLLQTLANDLNFNVD